MPIRTDIIIVQYNHVDIMIHDKVNNEITIVKVGITFQDSLQTVEVEKKRNYKPGQIYKCKIKIIPYVIIRGGIVTTYHESYRKKLEMEKIIEASYIQSMILKRRTF